MWKVLLGVGCLHFGGGGGCITSLTLMIPSTTGMVAWLHGHIAGWHIKELLTECQVHMAFLTIMRMAHTGGVV
ncbi:uncharacterized protein B0H64DRAFT_404643 [Chaetomium fimeti]|uniref:Uncharacterized protein n=1 Tax=Chaetomium fimeti TaxID=1854472 RepID=A0AAE0HBG5_9PEZI|nr:hypothetical protein B0H64DRAFT_404643 [Chaetomium fimeti]